VDPGSRISLEGIMHHNFYVGSKAKVEVDKYWSDVQNKRQEGSVPFRPNPLKYSYLLSNSYEPIKNTDMPMEQASEYQNRASRECH